MAGAGVYGETSVLETEDALDALVVHTNLLKDKSGTKGN